MIKIESLCKNYGSKQVLQNISVTFEKGKVYGIVGENGAGKTTLFRCLAGLEPCEGKVLYENGPLKNRLGFLETEPWFFPKITGGEYLQLMCTARHTPLPDLGKANLFDLPLGQYATSYSTGMKKKLALTAILLVENEVLVLDEPFNGVDIHSNLIITEIILRLKRLQKTVLLASHIFATLQDTCDVIYPMQDGRLGQPVFPPGFAELEKRMRDVAIGNRIEQLGLQ
jgi:ABC-2 type transport system ATP-binding protein